VIFVQQEPDVHRSRVYVTLTFGLSTPLGRAPSKITFDGRGGFLLIPALPRRGHDLGSQGRLF